MKDAKAEAAKGMLVGLEYIDPKEKSKCEVTSAYYNDVDNVVCVDMRTCGFGWIARKARQLIFRRGKNR